MKTVRIRWLGDAMVSGRGVLHAIVGGRVKVVYPGEICELESPRAEVLIGKGYATMHLQERVEILRDPEFPLPSKAKREAEERMVQKNYDTAMTIVLEARLHPNRSAVDRLDPVPVEEV